MRAATFVIFLFSMPLLAQTCDCPRGMEHLCRCNVLIDDRVSNMQLGYLKRLFVAEFAEFIDVPPQCSIRVGFPEEMVLKGEPVQGFIDTDPNADGVYQIVISPGLRRDEALMVAAHELGHAWQFSSRPDAGGVERFLSEGFAEWVAFYLLKRAGMTEFSYSIKKEHDLLYGAGFRWFRELERDYGRGAVISVMLNWMDRSGHRG